jgi:hypothetical protein
MEVEKYICDESGSDTSELEEEIQRVLLTYKLYNGRK